MKQNIFSVPIYVSKVDIDEQTLIEQTILNTDFNFIKGSDFGLESDVQITHLYDNFFEHGDFEFFESVMQKHLLKYLNEVQSEILDFEIYTAWITKTLPGQVITPHNHRDADISCVYYVQTNGEDGDLSLYSPNPGIDASRWINQGSLYKIKPIPGQIVFFPAWLLHATTTNKTTNVRISVAIDLIEKK